jgi:hypothetical protein
MFIIDQIEKRTINVAKKATTFLITAAEVLPHGFRSIFFVLFHSNDKQPASGIYQSNCFTFHIAETNEKKVGTTKTKRHFNHSGQKKPAWKRFYLHFIDLQVIHIHHDQPIWHSASLPSWLRQFGHSQ